MVQKKRDGQDGRRTNGRTDRRTEYNPVGLNDAPHPVRNEANPLKFPLLAGGFGLRLS